MRVVWLVVLTVGAGCRISPESASGPRDDAITSSAARLSAEANAVTTQSGVMPVAFSPELNRGVAGDRHDPILAVNWQPASQNNTPLRGEIVVPVLSVSLSLDAAIQTALAQNPDLIAVRSGEPVARAAYQVARTYPFNPQFQTQVLPYTRDRNGNDAPVSQQHVIVQTFELAGQSRFRSGAAAANWEQVRRTIRQAELVTSVQAERLYFTALFQWELRKTNQLLATLNDKTVGVIERRLKAGQANSADVALARLQAQSARRQLRLAEANYQTSLMNLRNFLNLSEDASVILTGRWLDWEWKSLADVLPDANVSHDTNHEPLKGQTSSFKTDEDDLAIESSVRRLVAERPDVAAARATVAMARENLALADAMRTPNLQIGPMWQRDDSATQFWGVQAQMNIPVVNTGRPLVRLRRMQLQQQQVIATRLEEKAMLEARAAIQRYERARRLVEQSRGEFAQTMPDVLKTFEDQFQAGQIILLQVFAARTSLAQSRQSFQNLLNELTQAAADVTQATGLPARQLILDQPPALNESTTVPVL